MSHFGPHESRHFSSSTHVSDHSNLLKMLLLVVKIFGIDKFLKLPQSQEFVFKKISKKQLRPKSIAFTFTKDFNYNYTMKVNGVDLAGNRSTKDGWQIVTAEFTNKFSQETLDSIYFTPKSLNPYLASIESASTGKSAIYILIELKIYIYKGHSAFYIEGDLRACQVIETGQVTGKYQNDTVLGDN
jgi:hypothetical protein